MASNSTRPKCAFYILLLTSLWMFGGHIGKLNAQCTGPTLNLPDASSQPVLNPPNPYCTTINIDPAVTGHPIGLQMMLEHDWQGDLSIRINACGGTLMLLTRPGGGSCAGGCACGSSADIGTVGNPALVSFSDGGGPNPDLGIPITGGNFGLSTDPCGANSMISSFASLASLCGGAPYTIQVCITDHVGANDGIATNIRPMFPGIVCGCNDPAALNYNPAATVNDGTCTYPPPPLTCGSVFYDSGGASGSYSNGENTTTTICPTTPGDIVTVTFTAFNTESSYDKLYVYNGPNASSPQISSGNGSGSGICTTSGGFWGTSIPGPFTSTHPGGCLTFVFCSDGSLTYSGWAANVTCSTPCTPPAAPTASGQTIPPNTSCTLTASGCAGTLRWYNAPSGGTQVGTGSPFVTPVLSATTTYYVECSSGSCASARTPVTVTVQNPPAMPSCGANTWNVSVFSDNTYTTFMGFYNTPGHSISPGDGGNDPLDIEFNVGKDGVPVNGFPSQANGYTGLPLTDEAFSIRAERCGFPCGAYYYINVRAFDDHVRVRVDQTGDGTYEFDYSNGPPRSTTPTDIWNGFLGPNSRVIIEGYNIGPGHPLYVSPNEFFLHVAFYNDQNHPLLTANAGADANFCSPGSVGIGGTPAATQGVPGYTYSWSPAGTLSNSGIANPTASPASPTTYTLTVTDARGCTATDNVTVTPMLCCTANAGAVAINPNPPCPGGIFTASATGHQTAAGYTQTFILVSNTGSVLAISPSGNFTMPAACGTYAVYSYNYLTAGTAITNPATIGQIVCQPTHCCDLSAPLTFTTSATVTMPADAGSTVACVSAATAPTPPDVMYSCGGLLARSGPVAGADPACAGVKTYVWTYTDACNSQTYNWTYTYTISAPTVSMPAPGASTVGCASAAVQPTPPNVTDNCGRALTPSGPVVSPDPACAGTKTYTWTYTDCAGNPYTWVYTYTISAPTVSMPAPGGSSVSCTSAAVPPTPPNVTDNCGRALTPSGPVISPDPACAGTKTYTWTYTDCAGNPYTWVYTYTITAPTVTMPAPGSSAVSCVSAAVQPTPPNVTDNCGNTLTPSGPVVSPDPACAGAKTYTWTYTDCAGSTYNWVYTYTITAPTVSMPAAGASTVDCVAAAVPPTPPNVADNCGRPLTPSSPVISPDPACAGAKTYIWTYTDCAGNPYTWVYTYTISAPTVSMPAPGGSSVSCASAAVQPTPPNVTDNCGRA
ncbi:MAG: hypothetical protein IAE84_05240, partial [Saprospiraceae bacterium]|nr:hypothetical protein [Saprospiraceae bacterium]